MLARIIKTNAPKIVMQGKDGCIYHVPKSELEFKYKLGDIVEIIEDEENYYFLPYKNNENNFEQKPEQKQLPTIPKQHPLKGVSGWLEFYIVIRSASLSITLLFCIIGFLILFFGYTEMHPISYLYIPIGLIITLELYAVISLAKSTKKSVVSTNFTFICLHVLMSIVALFNKNSEISLLGFTGIIYFIAWAIYFGASRRIKNTYID